MLVVIAAAYQSIASAQEPPKRSTPAAKPAPPARTAPAARPAIPQRQAPVAQPRVQRQAPVMRQAPQRQAPVAQPYVPQRQAPTAQPFVPQRQAPTVRQGPALFGPPAGAARALAIRGASRATIAGQNFSIRRGSYRVRRGEHWRTFVGPSALSAIFLGFALYYPYAYIDVSDDYCQGWTEDGCQLQWTAVPTYEGPSEFQCVAYCPWQ